MNFTPNWKNFSVLYGTGILASLLLAYFLFLLRPVVLTSGGQEAVFIVDRGENFISIGAKLSDAGLIRSRWVFNFYSMFSLAALNFKAGLYAISPSMSAPEIINKLFRGPGSDIETTIVEGGAIREIDNQLSAEGIINNGALLAVKTETFRKEFEFLKDISSLEGFLFPDTYRFYTNSPAETIAQRFLENFSKKAWPLMRDRRLASLERGRSGHATGDTLSSYEILILASLIEKEVPFHNDRLIVSGILRKRLSIGMALQVDAASETYQRQGLPEKPIGNPGLDAIFAAVNPKTSPYLYYLSDPKTKKTIFAEDFEQHKENKSIYIKNN